MKEINQFKKRIQKSQSTSTFETNNWGHELRLTI
jgi:hypothetical protein